MSVFHVLNCTNGTKSGKGSHVFCFYRWKDQDIAFAKAREIFDVK